MNMYRFTAFIHAQLSQLLTPGSRQQHHSDHRTVRHQLASKCYQRAYNGFVNILGTYYQSNYVHILKTIAVGGKRLELIKAI
jgi:hypothetical protein